MFRRIRQAKCASSVTFHTVPLERGASCGIDLIQREIQEYYWNFIIKPDLVELRNIATVAELIVKCARKRKESRGLHYNIDYPEQREKYLSPTLIEKKMSWLY